MAKTIANTKTGIRKLNTKVNEMGDQFYVTLYDTMVYAEDATSITLNNGGWATPTTASRINQAFNYRGQPNVGVSIKQGVMYFRRGNNPPIPFVNGVFVIEKGI